MQIACRSGIPPSQIADSWSPDELQDAEVLGALEGWGQDKRRTAQLQSTVHNAAKLLAYWMNGNAKTQPPKLTTESDFLPRRTKPKAIASHKPEQSSQQQLLMKRLSAMCGYK